MGVVLSENLHFVGEPPKQPPDLAGVLIGARRRKASGIYAVNESIGAPYFIANDSLPNNAQGTEVLTVSMAAQSKTSALEVVFNGQGTHTTGDQPVIVAIFVDNEQYARRAILVNPPAAGFLVPVNLRYSYVPGDTLAHTIRVRVGTTTGTVRFNGSSGGRIFGGANACTLDVSDAGEPP